MNTRQRYIEEKSIFHQLPSCCPKLSMSAKTSLTIATLFIAAPHIERASSALLTGIQFFKKNFTTLFSWVCVNPKMAVSITVCTFLFWNYVGDINTPLEKKKIIPRYFPENFQQRNFIPRMPIQQQVPVFSYPVTQTNPFYPQQYVPFQESVFSQNMYPSLANPHLQPKIFELEE